MRKLTSAQVAKERLQYAIAIDRAANDGPEYKPGNHRIFGRDVTVQGGDVVLLWHDPESDQAEVVICRNEDDMVILRNDTNFPSMLDIDQW